MLPLFFACAMGVRREGRTPLRDFTAAVAARRAARRRTARWTVEQRPGRLVLPEPERRRVGFAGLRQVRLGQEPAPEPEQGPGPEPERPAGRRARWLVEPVRVSCRRRRGGRRWRGGCRDVSWSAHSERLAENRPDDRSPQALPRIAEEGMLKVPSLVRSFPKRTCEKGKRAVRLRRPTRRG